MTKTRALGRGIDSLMGSIESTPRHRPLDIQEASIVGSIAEIPLDEIEPNPENPRKEFPQEYLDELATSILALGIIQPITVRKLEQGGFQIISGECRFRASKQAGLSVIPAYIRIATDIESLEMAVTENIQRKDLNPIEIAIHYKAMMDGCKLTQENLSERLGKSRPAIANQLRLLKLPAEVQLALRNGDLTMGHAKPLIALESDEQRIHIVRQVLDKGLSVRQVEDLCKKSNETSTAATTDSKKNKTISQNLSYQHEKLSAKLGCPVEIKSTKKGVGHIQITFRNDEEFLHLSQLLLQSL